MPDKQLEAAIGFTAGWEFRGLRDASRFFSTVGQILLADSILVLEERSMAAEIHAIVAPAAIEPRWRIEPGTVWPKSRTHWVPVTDDLLEDLARRADHHAEPELCNHLYVVRDRRLILDWHDAFDGPLLVSDEIPADRIETFAKKVWVSPVPYIA